MTSETNPWLYEGRIFTEEDIGTAYGFVYRITNLTNNRDYIGKKFFTRAKTRVVKGKKKRSRVSSDWQDYYSSSEELNEDVKKFGASNFRREILRLCKNKTECSYYEAKYQFQEDVLLTDSYCKWISVKVRKSPSLRMNDAHDTTSSGPSGRTSE